MIFTGSAFGSLKSCFLSWLLSKGINSWPLRTGALFYFQSYSFSNLWSFSLFTSLQMSLKLSHITREFSDLFCCLTWYLSGHTQSLRKKMRCGGHLWSSNTSSCTSTSSFNSVSNGPPGQSKKQNGNKK